MPTCAYIGAGAPCVNAMIPNARPIPFERERAFAAYWEALMLDLIMVSASLAFFGLSISYAVACDRL